ncbi:histidine phosphatase family protein [Ascidiaceihabitans sp.]|uniref:histidine phosphatase family protein n=1 Tax=Ascidiaceihabitans sp. TaxID=1872644 RepID=UPI00329A75A3
MSLLHTTTWHWVRHGPTHQKTFVGWRDVPADLSDTDQLKRVCDALPEDALVISSDLTRCIDTADAMAANRQRLPHAAGLRELHFGSWDGVHFSDISDRHPTLSRTYWETPGDATPPGGESWNDAAHRVHTAVQHIAHQNPGRHIIAVAHFGAILTQVQQAMGISAQQVLGHKIDNLSVTTIDWTRTADRVTRINHLL